MSCRTSTSAAASVGGFTGVVATAPVPTYSGIAPPHLLSSRASRPALAQPAQLAHIPVDDHPALLPTDDLILLGTGHPRRRRRARAREVGEGAGSGGLPRHRISQG